MPAAIPIAAQIAVSSIASSVGLGGLASSALVAGAGLLGSYVASKVIGRDANSYLDVLNNIKLNTSTTQRTIPLIYGEHKVGSNDVFIEVSKGTKYMYIIHCLGEGECEGISTDKYGVEQVFVNEKLVSEYKSGQIEYWFHSGTNTQLADTNITSALGGKFTDPMRNTAYILFKIKYNKKLFTGVPTRTVVVKGLKVYDFRTSTTAWSQNPVLILYDYMTNSRYGLGWDTSLFESDSWEAAADYCDIDVPCSGKPKYYIDYYVGAQLKSQSIIETILSHFRGTMSYFGGKVYLHYTDLRYQAPVFSIEDDHIARSSSGKDMISVSQPSSFGIPDGVVVKYMNKRNNWTLDDIPIGDSEGKVQQIMFNAFSDRGLAFDMGLYTLERSRLNKTINVTLRPSTIELDINDVGLLESSELAIEGQLVRVKESSVTPDGLINVTLILESYNIYDSVYDLDLTDVYSVDLPSLSTPPPPVWNITFEEVNYESKGKKYLRLEVKFDEPNDYAWLDYVEVYFRTDAADDWYKMFNTADDFVIDPAQENTLYFFKLVSVNTAGIRQDDIDAAYVQFKTSGTEDVRPPDPTVLDVNGDYKSIQLDTDYNADDETIDDSEVKYWEYRASSTSSDAQWGESISLFLGRQPSPTLATNSMTPTAPASRRFWVAAYKDNSTVDGLYSSTPIYKDVKIEQPASPYALEVATAAPFGSGIFSGTIVQNGKLRINKTTGSPFSGYWISAQYTCVLASAFDKIFYTDLTVSKLSAPDRTWNGVARNPDPTPANRTWNFCFEYPYTRTWKNATLTAERPADVKVSFLLSTTSGGPYTEYTGAELRVVRGLYYYYKIKITITDDSLGYYTAVDPITVYVYKI